MKSRGHRCRCCSHSWMSMAASTGRPMLYPCLARFHCQLFGLLAILVCPSFGAASVMCKLHFCHEDLYEGTHSMKSSTTLTGFPATKEHIREALNAHLQVHEASMYYRHIGYLPIGVPSNIMTPVLPVGQDHDPDCRWLRFCWTLLTQQKTRTAAFKHDVWFLLQMISP
jgi:hypothetical protein